MSAIPSPSRSAATRSVLAFHGDSDFQAGAKRTQDPPGFRRLAAERLEMAIGLPPEVEQAVAIQVGHGDVRLSPRALFSSRPVEASRT